MDLLNISGEQSLDLPDLAYGVNEVPTGLINELTGGFLVGAGQGTIVSGFIPAAASTGGPVVIGQDGVRNVALLGHQTGKGVTYGVLSVDGNNAKAYDVGTYAPGTYGIYVRFNRQPAEAQTRVFWSGIDNAEYAKTTYTRLAATWEARIEVAQPAPEWLLIGQVVLTSQGSGQGNTVVVTDQRPLYFEGLPGSAYAPTWGTDADRGARQTATIGSLRRMVDALKQCIVDIKGPGLVPWTSRFVAGMNVGSRFGGMNTPVRDQLAIGDSGFALKGDQFAPSLAFGGAGADIAFARNSSLLLFRFGGDATAQFGAGRLALGQNIPNLTSPNQPLLVYGVGPFGRIAQFWHTGGSDPCAISLGNTANTGGRIDFSAPSISDWKSAYWSISGRTGVNVPYDFSIGHPKGVAFGCLVNGGSDYTTSVTGSRININATAEENGYVNINKLAVGQNLNAFADGGVPWLTYHYDARNDYFNWTGNAITVVTRFRNGYFEISTTAPLPLNACIILTVGFNVNSPGRGSYVLEADRKIVRVYLGDAAGNTQVKTDFSMLVFYGAPATAGGITLSD